MSQVPAAAIREQLVLVFRAWGMSEAHAATTADAMVETDLRGIDSHGIAMLPSYDAEFRKGRLNMQPDIKVVRDARLDRYLVAHQQFAGSTALGVPSGFLRNAAAEAPGR